MAASKKDLLKEITQLKKRFANSKSALRDVYKNFSKEAKKTYKDAIK